MTCNVGSIDRTLRIVAGLVILALGFYYKSWWGAVGAVPLLTGLMNWCPAYSLFGISSCAKKS
ncbi:YgaP family membrane protein [Thiothrix subterranea]|jgi:sulfite exporter TauE/SafE|uniref:DUF2892 domain-containing protein n=1 Tax=Thiothrix subterranea TaxID=2735563 RepID=A0AA51MML4_9GAMM|nr:DUF2892 domain-containing protein [Thiothrix subterranea]MDQ5768689.1 DUF2892 domain-containing protein [Thiothrix subterranea]WML84841.1 DUF2892 domain-containing protein [Thiothrix subterranea]